MTVTLSRLVNQSDIQSALKESGRSARPEPGPGVRKGSQGGMEGPKPLGPCGHSHPQCPPAPVSSSHGGCLDPPCQGFVRWPCLVPHQVTQSVECSRTFLAPGTRGREPRVGREAPGMFLSSEEGETSRQRVREPAGSRQEVEGEVGVGLAPAPRARAGATWADRVPKALPMPSPASGRRGRSLTQDSSRTSSGPEAGVCGTILSAAGTGEPQPGECSPWANVHTLLLRTPAPAQLQATRTGAPHLSVPYPRKGRTRTFGSS